MTTELTTSEVPDQTSAAPADAAPDAGPETAALHAVWQGEARRLGEILEQMGVVGAADVLLARYEQDLGDPRRMGEILVAQGLARQEQVDRAIDLQERTRVLGLARSKEATRVADSKVRMMRNVQSFVMFAAAVSAVVAMIGRAHV